MTTLTVSLPGDTFTTKGSNAMDLAFKKMLRKGYFTKNEYALAINLLTKDRADQEIINRLESEFPSLQIAISY